MLVQPWSRIALVALATLVTSFFLGTNDAQAKARLLTLSDGVIAYSGPGEFYRPLSVFPNKTEITAASRIITNKNGAFYRVIVVINEKKKSIGYVSVQANVRFIDDKLGEEDLEKYGEVALVRRAVQVSYGSFQKKSSLWTIGYMNYLSPGFYVKGFGGQFSDQTDSATLAGGEIGNDALLIGRVSGLVSYGLGAFSPSTANRIFEGSKKLNAFMIASVGARYNIGGVASISVAGTQSVFFNANNSLVSRGMMASIEVGL